MTSPSSTDQTLSERVRAATWARHEQVAESGFLGELTNGERGVDGLGLLARQLGEIYQTLEDAVAKAPGLAGFVRPELVRQPALMRDIAALDAWDLPVLPATGRYRDRVTANAGRTPELLGHHYVRYLGDLSGGLLIGAAIERRLDIGPDRGTAFYHFDQIDDPSAYRTGYRDAMDRMPFDADEAGRLVAEAEYAYQLNAEMLAALAGYDAGSSLWTP